MLLKVFLLIWIYSALTACSAEQSEITETYTPASTLEITLPTAGIISSPTTVPTLSQPTVEIIPAPSPTPMIYTVVENDTLIGLAVRYGLTLDELLAANPGVDPQFLSIGTELVIPIVGATEQVAVPDAIVPEGLIVIGPDCVDQVDGNVLCLFQVENNTDDVFENVQAQVNLISNDGEVTSKQIFLPLNILLSGDNLPAWVPFEGLAGQWISSSAQVSSVLPMVFPDEIRYIYPDLTITNNQLGSTQATVEGSILVHQEASVVWLLGAGYDAAGNLIAVRRWEWTDVDPSSPIGFTVHLYSEADEIADTEWWVEARP